MRNRMMNLAAKAATAVIAATAVFGAAAPQVQASEISVHQEPFEFLNDSEDNCEWLYEDDSWLKGDWSWKMAPCEID